MEAGKGKGPQAALALGWVEGHRCHRRGQAQGEGPSGGEGAPAAVCRRPSCFWGHRPSGPSEFDPKGAPPPSQLGLQASEQSAAQIDRAHKPATCRPSGLACRLGPSAWPTRPHAHPVPGRPVPSAQGTRLPQPPRGTPSLWQACCWALEPWHLRRWPCRPGAHPGPGTEVLGGLRWWWAWGGCGAPG